MSLPSKATDEIDPLEAAGQWLEVARRLFSSARATRRLLCEIAQGEELSEWGVLALWVCHQQCEAGLDQRALAAELAVSAAQISELVAELHRRELLAALRPANDRRRQVWRTTTAGDEALARMLMALEKRLRARPDLPFARVA
jgi:DNA-binding MarR family transcriptional regulator